VQGLRAALAARARQVFFVASHRKAQVLKAALVEAGEDAAAVAAIVAPAGQPIGAQTPEEIALSVLAAVVAARRGQEAGAPHPAPVQKSVGQEPLPRAQHGAAPAVAESSVLAVHTVTPALTEAAESEPEFVVRAGPMSCCGM
jgi:xanthine dehydrogenase accessory factor